MSEPDTEMDRAPIPRPTPPPPGSNYQPDWYVTRAFEEDTARGFLDAPRPVLLWGPRGQGASWLCRHIAATWQADAPDRTTGIVDFDVLGRRTLDSLDTCLLAIVEHLLRTHPIPADPEAREPPAPVAARWAASPGTPRTRFTDLVEAWLAGQPGDVLLVFDHADLVHAKPFYEDFAALLRSLAERGATISSAGAAPWDRLRLVVSVSVPMARLGVGTHESPFANLSPPIILTDLDADQVSTLAEKRALESWTRDHTEQLMDVVGGHPYLVCAALADLARGRYTLEDLGAGADLHPASLLANRLQRERRFLDRKPALARTFAAVARGTPPPEASPPDVDKDQAQEDVAGDRERALDDLVSRGLVARERGAYGVRYPLYQRLLDDPEPPPPRPRNELAWWQVALAGALGAVLFAILILLLPSLEWQLMALGLGALGLVVFVVLVRLDPNRFYRRLLYTVVMSGLAMHGVGFALRARNADALLEWSSEVSIAFTLVWGAIVYLLIREERIERRAASR